MAKNLIPTPRRVSSMRHQREFAWQILLPVLAVALLFSGLLAWLAIGGLGGGGVNLANLSDISLIWLTVPMLLGALATLVALLAAIYGMGVLLGKAEPWLGKAQQVVLHYNDKIRAGANKAAQPVIRLRAWVDLLAKRRSN